jgi:hypothetical protein
MSQRSKQIWFHHLLLFICNSIEQKIYDYLYKDAAQAMFKKKATMATPKKDDVVVNMVLAVNTFT